MHQRPISGPRVKVATELDRPFSPRALGWMVEKICNKLIFSGIVQQAPRNYISKIPWNSTCGNYKILYKISFLVPLSLGQISAFLMTWFASQGLPHCPNTTCSTHHAWCGQQHTNLLRMGQPQLYETVYLWTPNDSSWPHCHTPINT